MNALEVSIDGKQIGIYVPPEGSTFAATIGNVPRKYMRAHIMTGTKSESWQWQLPDVMRGQVISFRMVNAPTNAGVPPQFVRRRSPREIQTAKDWAEKMYAKVKKQRAAKKRKNQAP